MRPQLFYTKLAKYYDKIYHYVDFKKQVEFFIKVIKEFNESGNNKILDVACGTGTHANLLNKAGFEVTGLDSSEEMLKEAKKKNPGARFILDSMREFKLGEKFGIVICFFNSILYNKNKAEMQRALSNFYSCLERGGILIFDAVDKSAGVNSKKERYEYNDGKTKIVFEPQWIYNKESGVLDLGIDFTINNKKLHDRHLMGAFSFEGLEELLHKAGFEIVKQERRDEKTAIFVCRKLRG